MMEGIMAIESWLSEFSSDHRTSETKILRPSYLKKRWWLALLIGAAIVVAIATGTLMLALRVNLNNELRKSLFNAAVTLVFTVLIGGLSAALVKVALEENDVARRQREETAATLQRRREDAAGFVRNVLADLKAVYDRVARVRIVIPAHRSALTYGNEMRDLIDARVQLRNVSRALHGRTDGVREVAKSAVKNGVDAMERYLGTLTDEFRDNYKRIAEI
jgi:NhaP-type Na+/H+ or K+/H+ antiporter